MSEGNFPEIKEAMRAVISAYRQLADAIEASSKDRDEVNARKAVEAAESYRSSAKTWEETGGMPPIL